VSYASDAFHTACEMSPPTCLPLVHQCEAFGRELCLLASPALFVRAYVETDAYDASFSTPLMFHSKPLQVEGLHFQPWAQAHLGLRRDGPYAKILVPIRLLSPIQRF